MPLLLPPRLAPGDPVRIVAPSGPLAARGARGGRAPCWPPATRSATTRRRVRAPGLPGRLRRAPAGRAARGPRRSGAPRHLHGPRRLRPAAPAAAHRPGPPGARPRPIVGFSDGTALLALAARAGLASVHGPVVTQLARLPRRGSQRALFGLLERPGQGLLLSGPGPLIPGACRGPCSAATWRCSRACSARPTCPTSAGAVLFLEDIGERPYRIDRLITHLDLAGVFSAVVRGGAGRFPTAASRRPRALGSPTADAGAGGTAGPAGHPGGHRRPVRPRQPATPRSPTAPWSSWTPATGPSSRWKAP